MGEKAFQDNLYAGLKVNRDLAYGNGWGYRLQVLNYVKKHLGIEINSGVKIAEVGCGCGYFSAYLLRNNKDANVDMYDISTSTEKVIDEVMRISKVPKKRYKFYAKDITKKFSDKKYDLIFIGGALHHAYELTSFFESIRESLKPGGLLICQEPAYEEKVSFQDLSNSYIERIGVNFKNGSTNYNRYDCFFKLSEYLVASRYGGFDLYYLKRWRVSMNHPEFYAGEKYNKNIILKTLRFSLSAVLHKYRNITTIIKRIFFKELVIINYLMVFKNPEYKLQNNWYPHLDLLGISKNNQSNKF